MNIKDISLVEGTYRFAVEVDREEASVISSLLGVDICGPQVRNRYVSIHVLEKSLSPSVLYRIEKIHSTGCFIVIGFPEEYLTILCSSDKPGERIQQLKDYLNRLSHLLKAVYNAFFK